jgi:hypothetical protein
MAQEIISRADAKAKGLKRFISKPCKFGHAGERYVSNCRCVACALAAALKRNSLRASRGLPKRTLEQKVARAESTRRQRQARRYNDQLAIINLF